MKRNRKSLREDVLRVIRQIDQCIPEGKDAVAILHDVIDTLCEPDRKCKHKFETISVTINKTRLVGDVARCEKCGVVRRAHEEKT